MASPEFVCANWEPGISDCEKSAKYTCNNCRLIAYCGRSCQKSHWAQHKTHCRLPWAKDSWSPGWVVERRTPTFVQETGGQTHFGPVKYLWGNVPAVDVLQLDANEGADWGQDLRLLFIASGDLRNVVKTIAQLPSGFNHGLEATINDRDVDVVARNVIMLLIAFVVESVEEAVDCIIHVWYSAFVRKAHVDLLQTRIRPLIEEVCSKIEGKNSTALMAKTWTFGQRSLRLVLKKQPWDSLLSFFHVPAGLTAQRARELRAAITMAESRRDYHDRKMCCFQPFHRVCLRRFREDGMLLPFGSSRDDFQEPNPTFFRVENFWPMGDNVDPHDGWSSKEVAETSSGPATADLYGKLFLYICANLRSFLQRLSSLKVTFQLFRDDALDVVDHIQVEAYDRIEVSNLSDACWLGIYRTLALMVPLLQRPSRNPHATLITLFMNAVTENSPAEVILRIIDRSTKARLKWYITRPGVDGVGVQSMRWMKGLNIITKYDDIFDGYSSRYRFNDAAGILGAAMKEKNTIVEPWPYGLKLQPGQPGAQEEFDRLLEASTTGKERYVEWKRIREAM